MTLIGLDTETALIERGLMAPPLACVAYAVEGFPSADIMHARHCLDVLLQMLRDPKLDIVGTNISYDMAVLLAEFGTVEMAQLIFAAYEAGRIVDIQIAQRLLDIAHGLLDSSKNRQGHYSLDAINQLYGGAPMDKNTWRLLYGRLRDIPLEYWPQGAIDYAKGDALRPVELLRMMCDRRDVAMDFPGIFDQLGTHGFTHFCLHLMSCRGVHTDPIQVEQFRHKVRTALHEARELLLARGLLSPKPGGGFKRNTKPAKAYMYAKCEELGIPMKFTPKGDVSLDADACNLTGDPVLQAYTTWTTQSTLLNRVEILAQGYDKPLQSRFVYPLETSRSSCRHPAEPLIGDQLQNAPKVEGYRECIVPRAGYCFMIADFSGMELATIAQVCLWVCGHSRLAQLLNDGTDLHSWLGARILDVPYERVVQAKRDGGPKELLQARALGKVGNFSFWGMAGPKRIVHQARVQYGVRMTLDQAYVLQRTAQAAYPEMTEYHMWINGLLARTGGVIRSLHPIPEGERIDFLSDLRYYEGDYRGDCEAPAAANGHFQRLGADGSNAALRAMTTQCYARPDSVLFGSRPVIFFHDEIVAEVPIANGHECAMASQQTMEHAFRQHVPDVRSDIEPVLATCWSKKAQQVWENGRLVPWSPERKAA